MFNILQYDFVQNAFLAGMLVAIMAAVIGYFVVLRAQAFAGEAFADIGFVGTTGAAILGISSLLGMLGLTLLAALGIGALGERVRGRDIEIGMVLSFALGLGVLFLSIYIQRGADANAGVSVLFGSILTVTRRDVIITLFTGSVTLLIIALLFRPLLFASVDPELAQARGVPVRLLSIVFLLLLAISTAEAVLVIGVLLVFALLIAPAAAAVHLTHQPLSAIILSIILGLAFTWGGLILAFVGTGNHFPVSFYISTMAALTYFASLVIARFRTPRRYTPLPHPNRECNTMHTRL
jgi:zinc/manganese transport system permease protein